MCQQLIPFYGWIIFIIHLSQFGISPEYSLEGLMLKLKLHLMRRTDSFEKTLVLGKMEGGRRRG